MNIDENGVLRLRICGHAACRGVFTICARCDRGQRYCSAKCRLEVRRRQRHDANRRYQQSEPGRQSHRRCRGFSVPNLYRMRQFFEAYPNNELFSPLVREISWTKNMVILDQCKEPAEREFYLRRTKQFGWSKNVLIHHIENQTYQKTV
jgi:hypothetical protein